MKHTQGEWRYVEGINRFLVSSNLEASDKNSICATAEGTETDEANAKLIASAPELLSTLNSLMMSMRAHPDNEEGSEFADFVSLAEDTIKKATE